MDNGTALFCIIVPIIVLVAIFVLNGRAAAERAAQLRAAQDAYHGALAELKAAPTNPDVKERALELGRIYSNLTRESKGVTVYDEMALANDISAATAGANAMQPVEDRLRRLDEMRTSGMITSEEHAAQRGKILGEV